MKTFFTIFFITFCLFITVYAQDEVHIVIKKTNHAPQIDGVLDEIWQGVEIEDEFNAIEDAREDEFDCTPSFRVMWDDSYLYYFVKVIDDYLNVDETSENLRTTSGGWGWADDCVELYLDGDNSKTAKWNEDLDAAQMWWLPYTPGIYYYTPDRFHIDTTNFVYAQQENFDGWQVEIAIPLLDANIKAEAGTIFGFEVDVGDDDTVPFSWRNPGPGGRETKLKWFYTEDKTEPIYFGNAQLSDEMISSVSNKGSAHPVTSFELKQNFPNPFNPATSIAYTINKNVSVELTVYDMLGKKIKTLVNEFQHAGSYSVEFDASQLNSGLYLYKLKVDNAAQFRKMTLIK